MLTSARWKFVASCPQPPRSHTKHLLEDVQPSFIATQEKKKTKIVEEEAALNNPQFFTEKQTGMKQHAAKHHHHPEAVHVLHENQDTSTKEQETNANATDRPSSSSSSTTTPLMAILSTYRDDIRWVVSHDDGSANWSPIIPTKIYQVADIEPRGCSPIFPGLYPALLPSNAKPKWPRWAEQWVASKCDLLRQGIVPGSIQDSERMAAIDAGLMAPPMYTLNVTDVVNDDGILHYERLNPLLLHLVPNRASEGLAYLSAIIDLYDEEYVNSSRMPDVLLFMHAHRSSWHSMPWGQDWQLKRLSSLDDPLHHRMTTGFNVSFMQLGCIELEDQANRVFPTVIGANHWSPRSLGGRWHESFAAHFQQAWIEHLQYAFESKEMPKYVKAACCASFAVTREAVKSRKKEFYVQLREWVLTTAMEKYWVGVILEFTWHMMFLNGEAVYDPPKEQCLCVLYGICL